MRRSLLDYHLTGEAVRRLEPITPMPRTVSIDAVLTPISLVG
ncbi:MAG: hypothetical protein V3R53_06415 [Gammaproteobacteria bacterium]